MTTVLRIVITTAVAVASLSACHKKQSDPEIVTKLAKLDKVIASHQEYIKRHGTMPKSAKDLMAAQENESEFLELITGPPKINLNYGENNAQTDLNSPILVMRFVENGVDWELGYFSATQKIICRSLINGEIIFEQQVK